MGMGVGKARHHCFVPTIDALCLGVLGQQLGRGANGGNPRLINEDGSILMDRGRIICGDDRRVMNQRLH